ncbi:hypothetical protein [Zavarzinella formosa]|uniref:hypothetical protein n=1 Tax=Zavarzinella formosa TaxID=360055 RepID=UPI000360EDB7|nr:hypothetical protein [Zavarzinella formosa]
MTFLAHKFHLFPDLNDLAKDSETDSPTPENIALGQIEVLFEVFLPDFTRQISPVNVVIISGYSPATRQPKGCDNLLLFDLHPTPWVPA